MAEPWGGKQPTLAKDRTVHEGWWGGYEGEFVISREHTNINNYSIDFLFLKICIQYLI